MGAVKMDIAKPRSASGADAPVQHDLVDNKVLDDFSIPFGEWMDQAVDWITLNLDWLLRIVERCRRRWSRWCSPCRR